MFLRRRCKTEKGARYDYWSLCESVRTAAGPRQRAVASPGKLTGGDEIRPAAGWEELRALLEGRPAAQQMRLREIPPPTEPGKEEVPWADIAAVLTTARFCAQGSELGIAGRWFDTVMETLPEPGASGATPAALPGGTLPGGGPGVGGNVVPKTGSRRATRFGA